MSARPAATRRSAGHRASAGVADGSDDDSDAERPSVIPSVYSSGPAGAAAGGQADAGHEARVQVVADPVEDRHLQPVTGQRVIEGVAADLVGRLQHGRDQDPLGRERARHQEAPDQLGLERHLPGSPARPACR